MTIVMVTFAGALAAIAEVGLLARTARQRVQLPAFVARWVMVAAVLLLATRAGHPLAGSLGWLIGFLASVVIGYRRCR